MRRGSRTLQEIRFASGPGQRGLSKCKRYSPYAMYLAATGLR